MGRVLVVDDTPNMADLVARILRRAGHETSTADDGAAAVAVLSVPHGGARDGRGESPPFDLVLLDVMMPGLDGFGVPAAVRADPRTNDLPVVMFTALDDTASRRRAIELGAQGYLVKGQATYEDLLTVASRHGARREPPLM